MPRLFIPSMLQPLTGGIKTVDVPAETLQELIDRLESQFPGLQTRLCLDGALRPGLTVAINGRVTLTGLSQKLPPDCEVHFLPAVGGG